MRRFAFAVALSVAGCGNDPQTPPLPDGAVLKEHISVVQGGEIEPASVLISMDAERRTYLNGKALPLKDVLEFVRTKEFNSDPILLEIHPSLIFGFLHELFEELIGNARRVNIAFLVSTPKGYCALSLPILMAHGCDAIIWFDGRTRRSEQPLPPEPGSNIWLRIRAGAGGAVQFVEFDHGEGIVAEDPIYPGSPPQPAPKGPPPKAEWDDAKPPPGIWTPKMLRDFLDDPRVTKYQPFVNLEVRPSDKVADVLPCLSTLKSVSTRVLASIKTR